MTADTALPRNTVKASFTIERHYKASPGRVFQAFADEERKKAWFGAPEGFVEYERRWDFRVDGVEVLGGRHASGVVTMFYCTYHDITPDERIVYAYRMTLDGAPMSSSLATIELKPDGDGTHLTLTEYGVYFDGFREDAAQGREHGTNWLMDKLGAILEGQVPPDLSAHAAKG
jgi:uncharacterized protein YndB with AHSA1/START domain